MDDFAALRLQIEWGADEALDDAPVARLARARVDTGVGARSPPQPSPASRERRSEASSPASLGNGPNSSSPAPLGNGSNPSSPALLGNGSNSSSPAERGRVGEGVPSSRTAIAERALQAALGATDLETLRTAIAGFDGCVLRDTAGSLVFAEGDPAADLLLIGDAPTAAEDRSGKQFAGPAGDYLDRMLASIGLDRSRLLLTPLIPWRPPGDRPPSAAELAMCLPFLFRLIALSQPRRLVVFGALPIRTLLGQAGTRRRTRGTWQEVAIPGLPDTLPMLPTFSPAELMRNPADRRAAWADLRLLRRTLDSDAASA